MNTDDIKFMLSEINDDNIKLFIDFIKEKNIDKSKQENVLSFLWKILNLTKESIEKQRINNYIEKVKNIKSLENQEKDNFKEIEFNY